MLTVPSTHINGNRNVTAAFQNSTLCSHKHAPPFKNIAQPLTNQDIPVLCRAQVSYKKPLPGCFCNARGVAGSEEDVI